MIPGQEDPLHSVPSFNPYDVLQLQREASQVEIKRAYHRLALKHHPDKTTGGSEIFLRIDRAYDILSDEKKRRIYDRYGEIGLAVSSEIPWLDIGSIGLFLNICGLILVLVVVQLVLFCIRIDGEKLWPWHAVAAPAYIISVVITLLSFICLYDRNFFPPIIAFATSVLVFLIFHSIGETSIILWSTFGLYLAIELLCTSRGIFIRFKTDNYTRTTFMVLDELTNPAIRITFALLTTFSSMPSLTGNSLSKAPLMGLITTPLYLLPGKIIFKSIKKIREKKCQFVLKSIPLGLYYTSIILLTVRLSSTETPRKPYLANILIPLWIILVLFSLVLCLTPMFLHNVLRMVADDASNDPKKLKALMAPKPTLTPASSSSNPPKTIFCEDKIIKRSLVHNLSSKSSSTTIAPSLNPSNTDF